MGAFPCLDESRGYRSFPCSRCRAEGCAFGKKPIAARPRPVLNPGERECGSCYKPFQAYGKGRYCGDPCRKEAAAKRHRERKRREGRFIY